MYVCMYVNMYLCMCLCMLIANGALLDLPIALVDVPVALMLPKASLSHCKVWTCEYRTFSSCRIWLSSTACVVLKLVQ